MNLLTKRFSPLEIDVQKYTSNNWVSMLKITDKFENNETPASSSRKVSSGMKNPVSLNIPQSIAKAIHSLELLIQMLKRKQKS